MASVRRALTTLSWAPARCQAECQLVAPVRQPRRLGGPPACCGQRFPRGGILVGIASTQPPRGTARGGAGRRDKPPAASLPRPLPGSADGPSEERVGSYACRSSGFVLKELLCRRWSSTA